MKNIEKQAILYYLRNIFKEIPDPNSPSRLVRLLSLQSKELFGYDFRTTLVSPEPSLDEEEGLCMIRAALYGRAVDKRQQPLAAPKYTDISDPKFDQTIKCLCDTFDVAGKYRPLLQCMIYTAKFHTLRKIINCFVNNGPREVISITDIDFFAMACGMNPRDIEAAIASAGPLVEAGIIHIQYGEYVFSKNFSRLINMEFKAIEEVISKLVGKPLLSELGRENFEYMSRDIDAAVSIMRHAIKSQKTGVNILLYGAPGVGKTEMAKVIAAEAGARLYVSPTVKEDREERLPALAQLHCALKREGAAAILFDEAEDVFSLPLFSRIAPSKLYLNRCLENNPKPLIWITNNIDDMDPAYLRRFSIAINVKAPDNHAKQVAWRKIFEKHNVEIEDSRLAELIRKYDVAMSVVDTAVQNTKDTGDDKMLEYTLGNLCRAITGRAARQAAKQAAPWSPRLINTDTDLEALARRIRDNGMRQFSLCLYGAPGVGKTAYAEHLGDILGMPVVKKRASDLMGMYVGQTEKNIANAFAEARERGAILVFDEADSFLRNREGAHHSWEVSAVNEMLTQMENADIPFICTTNLMSSLDPASLRRFLFKVKYDFMTPAQVADAFKHFFGAAPDAGTLRGLDRMTPGDFAVVKRKADIMGITEMEKLTEMLRTEQAAKGGGRFNIGF